MSMRERPAMTRRSGPPEDPQAFTRMQERLRQLTDGKPVPQVYPDEPNKPVQAVAQRPCLPTGYDPKADPPTLEWLSPVRGVQISTGGAYEVRASRSGERWAFTPMRGLDALGGPYTTAQEAREVAEAHYRESCG